MDQQLPGGIEVVVFDVGETLVDETRMWTQLAVAAGVAPFTLMGVIGALIERGEPHHKAWDMLGVAAPPGAADIRSTDLYPDVLDCLAAVQGANYAVGIAGNQPAGAARCLRGLGCDVDFIASSAVWGLSKPAAGFFSQIADTCGAEPHEILYVGDRLDNDIVPAAKVGFRTAWLLRGPWGHIHSRRPETSLADLRVESLTELASMFRSSSRRTDAEAAVGGQEHDPHIRSVRTSDADQMVDLYHELSYPASADQIATRLSRLVNDDTYAMWVAVNPEGGVDGFAAGHIVFPVEDDEPAGQLIALVTSTRARGAGLGTRLCETFEQWAQSRNAGRIVVNSGIDRTSAHAFYSHHGWEHTGLRYSKHIT